MFDQEKQPETVRASHTIFTTDASLCGTARTTATKSRKGSATQTVSDLFLVLARRSEEVRVGEVRRSVVERWEGRRTAKVELMSSEKERPTQAYEGRSQHSSPATWMALLRPTHF